MKYFSFILTMLFFSSPFLVQGQIDLEVRNCNNITANLSQEYASEKANTCWIEQLIAPNIWSKKTKLTSNLPANHFNDLEEGTYRVSYILSGKNGSNIKSRITSKSIEIKDCLDVENKESDFISSSNKYSIAPNPVQNIMNLSIKDFNPDANTEISIYNIAGKLILTETVKNNTHSIDMSAHHSGTYLIQVKVNEEPTYFEKMILITQ